MIDDTEIGLLGIDRHHGLGELPSHSANGTDHQQIVARDKAATSVTKSAVSTSIRLAKSTHETKVVRPTA